MIGTIFWNALFLIIVVGFSVGLYKLFEKAGEAGWKALVPVYNWVVWLKLIGKPIWWLALIFIPVIGILVLVSMVIELAKAFGKHDLKHHAAALLLPFYFFPKIGFDPAVTYLGPPSEQESIPTKTGMREWGDAILFAGVAALIIRTFFVEAFMIPTSSMERTLLAGDFLFVSKYHYGARAPRVPLAIPFIHNKIKIGDFAIPSYIDALQLPYHRLPGLTEVKRNDIVVFNYPAHDWTDLNDGAGLVTVASMKENYIKRCVGMPGDKLQIKDGNLYIDDAPADDPPYLQKLFDVKVKRNSKFFTEKADGIERINGRRQKAFVISFPDMQELGFRTFRFVKVTAADRRSEVAIPLTENLNWQYLTDSTARFYMTDEIAKQVEAFDEVISVKRSLEREGEPGKGQRTNGMYPQFNNPGGRRFPWNIDYYGPMVIPKKGMTVKLTPDNISLYWRCITAYEGNDAKLVNGKVVIDNQVIDSYTFELDYYWLMGDNRNSSEDSRFWGFVPEDHIVGKPLFVFMSYESDFGVRFSRIGRKYVH